MKTLLLLLALAWGSTGIDCAFAQVSDIAVGTAKTRKSVIAIPDIKSSGSAALAGAKVLDTLRRDLAFMDAFHVLDPKAHTEKGGAGITLGSFNFSDWTGLKVEYLIKSGFDTVSGGGAYELHVYETFNNKEVLNKKYYGSISDTDRIAHTAANDIVEVITGKPGVFLSKITMVCDRTGKKEIYTMNFDGGEVKQVTRAQSTAISPNWSPDGRRIAFSVITKNKKNIKNWNMYEYELDNGKLRLLSNQHGMNSGAAYSPDGSKIALTMSFVQDNPEIFVMNPHDKTVTRLTQAIGVDVDPTWSPDGKSLAFVSGRTGASMVYRMGSDGSNVTRLTFAGTYNASPSWSPKGDKIAFAGWIDRRFDVFIMNPDGSHIERLTQNEGSNEDPHYSPDGNLLAFSSNRNGQKNIYIMNSDGSYVKRLTFGLGNCTSPKWSNPIKR